MKVTIGAQYGDSASDKKVHVLKKALSDVLVEKMRSEYFRTIEEIGLVIRVSGAIWRFEPSGVSRVRYSKKYNAVTADIIVPEVEWKGRTDSEVRRYLARITLECFEQISRKTKKNKELIEEIGFESDFLAAIDEYLQR